MLIKRVRNALIILLITYSYVSNLATMPGMVRTYFSRDGGQHYQILFGFGAVATYVQPPGTQFPKDIRLKDIPVSQLLITPMAIIPSIYFDYRITKYIIDRIAGFIRRRRNKNALWPDRSFDLESIE